MCLWKLHVPGNILSTFATLLRWLGCCALGWCAWQAELAQALNYRAVGGAFDVSQFETQEEAEPPQRHFTVLVMANDLVPSNKKLQASASITSAWHHDRHGTAWNMKHETCWH